MSCLEFSDPLASPSPEELISLSGDILFGQKHARPEPAAMAALLNLGLNEVTVEAVAQGRRMHVPQMSRTLAELDTTLPCYQMLSDQLATDFPDSTLLFAGRDAEVLHDDLAITHPDVRSYLLPASTDIWKSRGMLDKNMASEFLENYGMSGQEVTTPRASHVLVDSGFAGTIGKRLDAAITDLHGVSPLATGRMAVRLVSVGPIHTEAAKPIVHFGDAALAGVKEWLNISGNESLAFELAVWMQQMPRYHGKFTNLEVKRGEVVAITDTVDGRRGFTHDIDRAKLPNSSVVNPVAAAVFQLSVVRAALERSEGVPRSPYELKPAANGRFRKLKARLLLK